MKINLTLLHRAGCGMLLSLVLLCSNTPARADVPAPDNILFGLITLNSNLVTAVSTNVSIEARRTPTGQAIATYRMGNESNATNFYVLRLPLEEFATATSSNVSLKGDVIYLVVKVGTVDSPLVNTTNYTILERGVAQRIDFGIAPVNSSPDTDNDGLPDAWELAKFGSLTNGANSLVGNGRTAWRNFVEGSDTNNFVLSITQSNGVKLVQFFGRKAEGVGYSNHTRYYRLENSTNLAAGIWRGVPGFTNVIGTNQPVIYSATGTTNTFFRGQVWLGNP